MLVFIAPFTLADSLSSQLAHYDNAQKKFEKSKTDFQECQKYDDDCSDIEEEILYNAVSYATESIHIMLTYIGYASNPTQTAAAQSSLQKALDDLTYVKTKEDFQAIVLTVKTSWTSITEAVKQKPVEDLKEEVDSLIEKGKLIDAKIDCGIDELSSSTSALDASYKEFSAQIAEAEKQISEADNSLAHNAQASTVLASVMSAQEALKKSQSSLTTALDALSAAGGSLCSEITVSTTTETETTAETDSEVDTEAETQDVEPVAQIPAKTVAQLVKEYDLSDYYYNADEAISSLKDYIDEKQEDNYDTSKAEDVLSQAQEYFNAGVDLIKNNAGKGALSKFLNAQQTAVRGLNSEYYKVGTSSSSLSQNYNDFVDCMQQAGYATQRDGCYEDYGISSGTAEDIESCLGEASSDSEEEECYVDAEDEADYQESSSASELLDRITALEDDLGALEDDVTALYDELSDSQESSSSDTYRDIDHDIDALLSDVQSQRNDYDATIDDINDLIDDENTDNADDDLTDLEDEVESYIEDIQNEIDDLQDEINSL